MAQGWALFWLISCLNSRFDRILWSLLSTIPPFAAVAHGELLLFVPWIIFSVTDIFVRMVFKRKKISSVVRWSFAGAPCFILSAGPPTSDTSQESIKNDRHATWPAKSREARWTIVLATWSSATFSVLHASIKESLSNKMDISKQYSINNRLRYHFSIWYGDHSFFPQRKITHTFLCPSDDSWSDTNGIVRFFMDSWLVF